MGRLITNSRKAKTLKAINNNIMQHIILQGFTLYSPLHYSFSSSAQLSLSNQHFKTINEKVDMIIHLTPYHYLT